MSEVQITKENRPRAIYLRGSDKIGFMILSSFAIAFLFITITIIGMVPINPDESIQYHAIACTSYDNAKYHTFWNSCDGSTDLNLLGLRLKRSYVYIGSLSSYLYYPFFSIFPSILMQRLMGVLFLIVIVGTLMLLEKGNKLPVAVIFGLSFPLAYQLINDTGPVRYGILMTVATPWLVRCITTARHKHSKVLLNAVLGFLLFLAVEDKPFFLYCVPSIALLTIAYNHHLAQGIVNSIKALLKDTYLSIVVFGCFTLMYLLLGRTSSGQAYILELMEAVKTERYATFTNLLSFMTNLQKFSNMVYDHSGFRWLNISLTLFMWLYAFHIMAEAWRVPMWRVPKGILPLRIIFTSFALMVMTIMLLVMGNAWTGHHFVYPYVFALFVVSQAASSVTTKTKKLLIVYSLCSVLLVTQLFFLVPKPDSSWERYRVFEYLRRETTARNYIAAHLSLGTYYVSSLYGQKEQLSIQIRKLDYRTAMEIIGLSETTKRKIICVCFGADCNSERLSVSFLKRIEFEEVDLSNREWKVYLERKRF